MRQPLYLEPGLLLQPQYYDINDKNKLVPSFYLSAGVSYTFKNMFSKWKKHTSQKVSTQEFNQMNEQINEMRKQINNLQEELENAKVVNSNQRIILEPMREMPSVAYCLMPWEAL